MPRSRTSYAAYRSSRSSRSSRKSRGRKSRGRKRSASRSRHSSSRKSYRKTYRRKSNGRKSYSRKPRASGRRVRMPTSSQIEQALHILSLAPGAYDGANLLKAGAIGAGASARQQYARAAEMAAQHGINVAGLARKFPNQAAKFRSLLAKVPGSKPQTADMGTSTSDSE